MSIKLSTFEPPSGSLQRRERFTSLRLPTKRRESLRLPPFRGRIYLNSSFIITTVQRIVFLGSKPLGYQCLRHILEQQSQLSVQVIGVGTNTKAMLNTPDQNILLLCQQYQLPLIERLADLPPSDLLISVQYHRILQQAHINTAQLAVNLHTAPLPEYRGCHPFSFAILDDAKEYGTTLHRLEAGIDSGDILFERRFAIPEGCFVKALFDKTQTESVAMFKQHLPDLLSGNFTPLPQSARKDTHPSSYHYRHEMNEIKQINLDWSAEQIERHIRATYFPPFEPPFALIGNKKVFFTLETE